MPKVDFDALPDDARLWVFGAQRPLAPEEERTLLERTDAFLADWHAHGEPLACARRWRDGRFLLIGVDERTVPPSGCSIDAMVGILKELEGDFGTGLTGHGPVFWRDGEGEIRQTGRSEFAGMAEEGVVDPETPVFDTTLTRVGELRAGKLEAPARESWHGRAFFGSARGATPPSG